MTDKILAAFWILLLVGFMGVVTVYVNEPDLWTVVVICLVMGAYDFFKLNRDSDGKSEG